MTLAIAIYAAVIANGGLIWQIYQWEHGRKLHLEVVVRHGASDDFGATLRIIAVNHSSYPVRVTAIGFDDPKGPAMQTPWTEGWPESSIPGLIPPRIPDKRLFLSRTSRRTCWERLLWHG